uniref:Ciliary neurotrophic factor n=1 Tax=Oryzias latipes TaxID=8090 RepID=A0A3P9JYL6_ORYLA
MATLFSTVLFVCCILESTVESTQVQRNRYTNSFSLARSTRSRVQQLLKKYKEQELGNLDFAGRSQQLTDLPLLSTDFDSWLQLSDWDRLHAAFLDMQAYWNILERKRVDLEKEEKAHSWLRKTRISLPQRFKHIQLDLRDLMNQVSSQMRFTRRSWMKPTPAAVHLNSERSPRADWDSRVEGYIALRDLDLYLTKLARDFLLLASKRHS